MSQIALVLRPAIKHNRHAVGRFLRKKINGTERFVLDGRVFDLATDADQLAFNALVLKLSNDPFVLGNGGLYPLVVLESAAAAAAEVEPVVIDLRTVEEPKDLDGALNLAPLILKPQEQADLLGHFRERLAAIKKHLSEQAAEAERARVPTLPSGTASGDLPPVTADTGTEEKDEATDNAEVSEGSAAKEHREHKTEDGADVALPATTVLTPIALTDANGVAEPVVVNEAEPERAGVLVDPAEIPGGPATGDLPPPVVAAAPVAKNHHKKKRK